MKLIRNLLLFTAFFLPLFSHANFVNKVNGGVTLNYIDFSIPGAILPMDLPRAYNSITALQENTGWNGAFGWGWTSSFESVLTVTAERNVILRDGFTGNTITFKPEKPDPAVQAIFYEKVKRAYFENKLGRKISEEEIARYTLPEKVLNRLKTDAQFRVDLSVKLGLRSEIPKDELMVSNEYGYQTIEFRNGEWYRQRDTVEQVYDSEGRLKRQRDKSGFKIEFRYSKTQKYQLVEMIAPENGTQLKFIWKKDKVVEISDNRNKKSKYSFDLSGNLVQSTDASGISYRYFYENKKFPHLLTKIEYLNEYTANTKPYREFRYDENGLITSHRAKNGEETQYVYGRKTQDPDNNFWTKTISKRTNGTTEEIYDEYLIKARADGSKYLYRQETREGNNVTLTLFTACCGKPIQITKNGVTTKFNYYPNGLLSEKVGPNEDIKLDYDPVWKKVTRVVQNGHVYEYDYDQNGNLTKAVAQRKESVRVRYDKLSRISEITTPEGKKIEFQYGNIGKPVLIAEKGIGKIKITYDFDGKIVKAEALVAAEGGRKPSAAKTREVVQQVMKSFQHFLDILKPAGVSLISS